MQTQLPPDLLIAALAKIALCLQVTKQERQAHVILATSDYSFLAWLSKSKLCVFALASKDM